MILLRQIKTQSSDGKKSGVQTAWKLPAPKDCALEKNPALTNTDIKTMRDE